MSDIYESHFLSANQEAIRGISVKKGADYTLLGPWFLVGTVLRLSISRRRIWPSPRKSASDCLP